MRVLAALATLMAVAQARLTGFAIPDTVKPGDSVTIEFTTELFTQPVEDVACSAGYTVGVPFPGTLGFPLEDIFLGPTRSNTLTGFNDTVTFPATIPEGPVTFRLGCMLLAGVFSSPIVAIYEANITIGAETSTTFTGSTFVDSST